MLGVLIVLRAFVWLLSDRAEKHARLRKLPDAGLIGELVVLSTDSKELSPGMSIPVPREGILGSVRSCDIVIPADQINKSHLSFSFLPGTGLLLRPFRGCEVLADGICMDARSDERAHPLRHGSFLQIGETMLRLRIFAGLDPAAGFDSSPDTVPASAPIPDPALFAPVQWPSSVQESAPVSGFFPASGYPSFSDSVPVSASFPGVSPDHDVAFSEEEPVPVSDSPEFSSPVNTDVSGRRRRSDRWEADWSE